MVPRVVLFFASLVVFLGATHGYLGWRLGRPLPTRARRRRVHLLAAFSAVALPALLVASGRVEPPALGAAFAWLAFLHMGLFTLVFAAVLAFDLAVGLLALGDHLAGRLRGRLPSQDLLPEQPERRLALLRGAHLGLLGLAGIQGGAGFVHNRWGLRVRQVEVPVQGLDPALQGLHIVQITDVHIGPLLRGDFLERVVEAVNALRPDLVAVTGDLVDGSVPELGPHVAALGGLRARHGAWFCTGNHEYYSGVQPWVEELRRLGLTVLLNEHRVVEHDGARLVVAGVTDLHGGSYEPSHAHDVGRALDGAPADAFRLLLAHQPGSVHDAAAHGVDLQLSGHTHGGQYFPGTVLVHLAHPYVRDLHLHGERTWIYVSCGTGFWGPPIRLGTTAEITSIVLRSA